MTSKRLNKIKYLWLAALSGPVAGVAWGASTFTPQSAVQYALSHAPAVAVATDRLHAAAAAAVRARSARLPKVVAADQWTVSDDPLAALAAELETRSATPADFAPPALNEPGMTRLNALSLAVSVPLYTGGAIRAGEQGGRLRRAAARDEREFTQQAVAAQVLTAYAGVRYADKLEAITQDALARADRHAKTTAMLRREGRIVASDELTAEVNANAAHSAFDAARAGQTIALARFRAAAGLAPDTAVTLAPMGDLDAGSGALPPFSQGTRGDIRAAEHNLAAAQTDEVRAKARDWPTVGVTASNTWFDTSPGFAHRSWSVVATVRETLYDGGETSAAADEAAARKAQAQAELRALSDRAALEESESHALADEAQARLARASANVLTAQEAAKLVRVRYGQGRTILIDVLQSEKAWTEAEIEQARATYDLARADITLHLATGSPLTP